MKIFKELSWQPCSLKRETVEKYTALLPFLFTCSKPTGPGDLLLLVVVVLRYCLLTEAPEKPRFHTERGDSSSDVGGLACLSTFWRLVFFRLSPCGF